MTKLYDMPQNFTIREYNAPDTECNVPKYRVKLPQIRGK